MSARVSYMQSTQNHAQTYGHQAAHGMRWDGSLRGKFVCGSLGPPVLDAQQRSQRDKRQANKELRTCLTVKRVPALQNPHFFMRGCTPVSLLRPHDRHAQSRTCTPANTLFSLPPLPTTSCPLCTYFFFSSAAGMGIVSV